MSKKQSTMEEEMADAIKESTKKLTVKQQVELEKSNTDKEYIDAEYKSVEYDEQKEIPLDNPIVTMAIAFSAGDIETVMDLDLQERIKNSSIEEQRQAIELNKSYCRFIPNLHIDLQKELISENILYSLMIRNIDKNVKNTCITATMEILQSEKQASTVSDINKPYISDTQQNISFFNNRTDDIVLCYNFISGSWVAYITEYTKIEIPDIYKLDESITINDTTILKFANINKRCRFTDSDIFYKYINEEMISAKKLYNEHTQYAK